MKKLSLFILFILLIPISSEAQTTSPTLIGYWHNWDDSNAPYIPLDQVDARYKVVNISFAVPQTGTDYKMEFIPDQVNSTTLISQIQFLQSQGRTVNISLGGAGTHIALDQISKRDTFINTMNTILNTYGFDGIDIDLEGNSVVVSGGTIAIPVDAKIINLIDAIKQIMSDYRPTYNRKMFLSMAPETAFVQGGMSAYGGIWGAYLPIIDALRDSIDILHVQLYNSGSMYGIDGNIYTQGTADFIVAMTEACIQGFNTSGGFFNGLPASKIVVGLPACSLAAGGGFADTLMVKSAIDYLIGNGPQPGSYSLIQSGAYADLRGMMTWSINWDAINSCEDSYQFAENFENIFNQTTQTSNPNATPRKIMIHPNPVAGKLNVKIEGSKKSLFNYQLYNYLGVCIRSGNIIECGNSIDISNLTTGIYTLQIDKERTMFIKQ